jgi:hypothetical protein
MSACDLAPYRQSRQAWEKANGPIPDGEYVLHRCDEPLCINLEHLFLGDQGANITDKFLKGRAGIHGTPRALALARQRADTWYPDLRLGTVPE